MSNEFALWFVVAAFGGAVGTSELSSRYRDAPGRAVTSGPALLYIGVNALASVAAFALIRLFDWDFGVSGEDKILWTQVLVAGFGSMVLFRTSLFNVRAGGQEISIGPSTVLQSILATTDRSVDRVRAQDRANRVANAMADVSFERIHVDLPSIALALMQNLPKEEQELFGEQLAVLETSSLSDHGKKLALGLALVTLVGDEVLIAALQSLRHEDRAQSITRIAA